jgi:glycerophosphoryl diester phosphodiesterase
MEVGVGAVNGSETGFACFGADAHTPVVRVDESVGSVAFSHEEVTGHPHTVEGDTQAPSDLHEHHGQGDRHADTTLQHLVEVGVARVVIVRLIAAEALVDKNVVEQGIEGMLGARGGEFVERGDAGGQRTGGSRSCLGQEEQRLVEGYRGVVRQKFGQPIGGAHEPTVANYGDRVPSVHPYLDVGHPIAFAHRGGASVHPENTERAFRHALDLGFTHIETDVHVTRDGVAIAFHDDRLERVTDRVGVIAELPWAEVCRARVDGTEPIMRLDELLEAFPAAHINLDPKHGAAVEPLADTILRTAAVARVMVGSFSDRRIDRVRRIVGDELAVSAGPRRTLALVARSWKVPAPLPRVQAAQVPVSIRGITLVTPRFISYLHGQGMQVHVWTINEADEMRRLLDLGVDGIMTDQPEVLRDVFAERGAWPPTR